MARRVNIPVIDFDDYNLNKKVGNLESLRSLSDEICDAFSTVGFCYIKNHGLPQESGHFDVAHVSVDCFVVGVKDICIDRLQKCTDDFFRLDMETKLQYHSEVFFGYRPLECDRYNPEREAPDLTEAFVVKFGATKWPKEVFSEMEQLYLDFSKFAADLLKRVLDVILLRFSESERKIIHQSHNAATKLGDPQCTFIVRSGLYPEVKESDVKEGQIRFGEHSDWGSITLVFQDEVGGLEVKTRDGEYIPVTPIPGTAVVNLGDMMQRWTCDKLIAAKHRVVFPRGSGIAGERKSLVAFLGPDFDAEIKCLDGTNKYRPITLRNYADQKLKELNDY